MVEEALRSINDKLSCLPVIKHQLELIMKKNDIKCNCALCVGSKQNEPANNPRDARAENVSRPTRSIDHPYVQSQRNGYDDETANAVNVIVNDSDLFFDDFNSAVASTAQPASGDAPTESVAAESSDENSQLLATLRAKSEKNKFTRYHIRYTDSEKRFMYDYCNKVTPKIAALHFNMSPAQLSNQIMFYKMENKMVEGDSFIQRKSFYDYYLKFGGKATAKKFSVTPNTVYSFVGRYRRMTGDQHSRHRFITDEEKNELLNFYTEHGVKAAAKRFKMKEKQIFNFVRRFKKQLNIASSADTQTATAAPPPVERPDVLRRTVARGRPKKLKVVICKKKPLLPTVRPELEYPENVVFV